MPTEPIQPKPGADSSHEQSPAQPEREAQPRRVKRPLVLSHISKEQEGWIPLGEGGYKRRANVG